MISNAFRSRRRSGSRVVLSSRAPCAGTSSPASATGHNAAPPLIFINLGDNRYQ